MHQDLECAVSVSLVEKFKPFESAQSMWALTYECFPSFSLAVSVGCGSVTSENLTYFEVSSPDDGPCNAKICKVSNKICQVISCLVLHLRPQTKKI